MGWYDYPPYVPVAERKRLAAKAMQKLEKQGVVCQPINIEGKTIAHTFWGKAWCQHLESYSDYANRLARGRTYVRNGSVIDLKVAKKKVTALVSGSFIYKVKITINKIMTPKWNKIINECAGKIDSLIELLQGKFSNAVMTIMTHQEKGLFPNPKEIKFSCSCPDHAEMCKHVAAVLYGVGARLDTRPEELFMLREADHVELINMAGKSSLTKASSDVNDPTLAESDLSSLFGIDMSDTTLPNKTLEKNKQQRPKKKTNIKKPKCK